MPARARNRVDLPLPEGPLSSTLSPGWAFNSVWASRRLPVGRSSDRSFAVTPELLVAPVRWSCRSAFWLATWMAASKWVRRSVVARQAARLS